MNFRNHRITTLTDTVIQTAIDQDGGIWTLVSTDQGEDMVITPRGRHIWADLEFVQPLVAYCVSETVA